MLSGNEKAEVRRQKAPRETPEINLRVYTVIFCILYNTCYCKSSYIYHEFIPGIETNWQNTED